jgi:predicted negative regulator of RcsB-dependent stress response
LTRHELKEQLQHDQFTDAVSGALGYASSHRQNVIRGTIALVGVLLLSGGGYWYYSHQKSLRQQDLGAALTVVDTPVGPANDYGKTFPTEDAKQAAGRRALSGVVSKYPGSREGLIAQYYLGTLKAQANDAKGAESDLRTVANSTSEVAPVARIALAQVYLGEKKITEAQSVLRAIVNSPTSLVSKAQAQILLAQIDESVNPAESKNILKSIEKSDQGRPAVSRAADQLSTQLAK